MTDDCDHDPDVSCSRCCTCDVCRMLTERGITVHPGRQSSEP